MDTNIIIWIIIGTGLFGGLINYFRTVYKNEIIIPEIIKPVLIGLAASALVPLFLNMISSDLLNNKDELTMNYFVFLGFCLIAAIFSGEFIDSIGQKVLNQISEVQKEIEENNTEDDTDVTPPSTEIFGAQNLKPLEEESAEYQILQSFINSKFTYRSVSGIAKQTSLDKSTTKKELIKLRKKGCVEVIQRQKGPRWKITSEGYKK
jgi:hypothetical protein